MPASQRKNKASGADKANGARASGRSSSSQGHVSKLAAIALLALVGLSAVHFFGSDSSTDVGSAGNSISAASPSTRNLLTQFSGQHNENLLWGTFRPGILFGVKSRTKPESVVAGLMWSSVAADGKVVNDGKLRHTCEESDTREGLKFGYSEHDGSSYAKQAISDPEHNLQVDTIFTKGTYDSWTMRVAGNVMPSTNPKKGGKILLFYIGIDSEFADADSDAQVEVEQQAQEGRLAVIRGKTPQLGNFRLVAVPSKSSVRAVDGHDIVAWPMPDSTRIVDVKTSLVKKFKQGSDGRERTRATILKPTPAAKTKTKSVIVLQLLVQKDFEVDFVFESGSSLQSSTVGAITHDTWIRKIKSNSDLISASSEAFRKRFEEVFKMQQSGKFSAEQIAFAQAATSAMLGGVGYFYGQSEVKDQDGTHHLPPRPLFSGVPSRSFFPRGFLWDEGFHQLLIGRWDPALSRDAIAHWFSLMHEDGWIPREQILGAEAVAKVPDWALAQHRTHANPPTLLLAIESLLENAAAEDEATISWLRNLFPALETWFSWFRTSQAGQKPGTFRWRGRNAGDGKLNAMTLGSGLDDYPRASKVSNVERHVDLHSWVAHGAGVLARVGKRAGLDASKVAEYQQLHEGLVASLDSLHWDDKRKRYCDYGLHSNKGEYIKHIVVKCGKEDDSSSVEHALTPKHFEQLQSGATNVPPCPADHPKFLFPLGDGQGGLMQRELLVPKGEKEQFVDHTGYVSLFPFLLRLVPADSPKLGEVLQTIGDDKRGLWSEYGLRSLAPSDRMYLRENAPGDAPYWRGPIWINCNFLAVSALRHYADVEGPHRDEAARLLAKLSHNLIENLFKNFKETGFLWEQYNPHDGKGQRTHPFNGWSSLVVLMMA